LLSELHAIDGQGINLKPLARAALKAQLADASWTLDTTWAKALLTKAFELALPDEEERVQLRNIKIGAFPPLPTTKERARRTVRNQIIRVASREKAFADQLIRAENEQLGGLSSQMSYSSLAESARQRNDLETAGDHLIRAIDIDPSQITAGFVLAEIAKTNRTKADELIVGYFERLLLFPLSTSNGSIGRIYFVVHMLVFPGNEISAPGPSVMRAYAAYVVQSFRALEVREPGSLLAYRAYLLRAWPSVNQYAPDLVHDFAVLEQSSRSSNTDAALPTVTKTNGKQTQDKANEDSPDENLVNEAIRQKKFSKARKLIDELPENSKKAQLIDIVNSKEALFFLEQNEINQAAQLAEKLSRAISIREVYPALIAKCVSLKDETCATSFMLRAIKQIKQSDTTLNPGPPGIPASVLPTSRDFDPVLDGLAKLTRTVLPVSPEVALIGLSETVAAANVSALDTTDGRVGFDISLFRDLVSTDETRVRQAAESFKDPFRRLLSLAAICQWKISELEKRGPTVRPQRKKN
jgi:hypothetical protein